MSRPVAAGARTAPLVFGMVLVGLGGTVATAAQTDLSLGQSGSIWLLICAVVILGFLIARTRTETANGS